MTFSFLYRAFCRDLQVVWTPRSKRQRSRHRGRDASPRGGGPPTPGAAAADSCRAPSSPQLPPGWPNLASATRQPDSRTDNYLRASTRPHPPLPRAVPARPNHKVVCCGRGAISRQLQAAVGAASALRADHVRRRSRDVSLTSAVHTHALCMHTQTYLGQSRPRVLRYEAAAHRPHGAARTLRTRA